MEISSAPLSDKIRVDPPSAGPGVHEIAGMEEVSYICLGVCKPPNALCFLLFYF